jgi:signal transduction histidine kinase
MNLDIGTVLVTSLLVGLALVLFSWSLALSARAPRWRLDWAWGNTALFVGVGLYLTQGRLTPWISVIVANGLVIGGYHLLESGLRRFADKPLPRWVGWSLAGAFVVPFGLFTLMWDLYQVRVIVYSLLVMAVWVRILFLLAQIPEYSRHPVLVRTFWSLCVLLLFTQAARAVVTLGDHGNSLLGPSDALALMLLVNVLVITAWSLGFVTLDIVRNQRQLELALETRDKMMQLIAHDLRGPLGAQVGLLELMRESASCGEEGEEMLGLLATSAQNSFELLENLLEWGQNQKGSVQLMFEDVVAQDLLIQASQPYATAARAKNLNLIIEADPEDQIRTDRRTVTTILRNLISNAVKFTPPGGEVRLSVWRREGHPEFVVADSGPGIPQDQLAKLNAGQSVRSTPGTENESGSGLGLALCRDFAALNRASLRFTSTPQGTRASLVLP